MNNEDGLKKLLEQGASATLHNLTPEEIKEVEIEKAIAIVEDGKTHWDKVAEKMNGEYADRFIKEMDALPGREFIRVYTKMIEYFRPKIVRVEGKPIEEQDNVIRIEIHNLNQSEETIDVEHKEE